MPVTGADKKAKPRDIFNVYLKTCEQYIKHPVPKPSESFAAYRERLARQDKVDPLLVMLMSIFEAESASVEVTKREYLRLLQSFSDDLFRFSRALYENWRG